ncbi:MAG: DUF4870 domain-containing protein [Anaerolineales bacterium]
MSEFSSPQITSDDKLWSVLSYVFAPIVGIIVLLLEDKRARPFIKYHAVQSIAASVAIFVLGIVFSIVTLRFGGLCFPLVWLVFFYWAYKAYQGEYVEIPWLTGFLKGQGWI